MKRIATLIKLAGAVAIVTMVAHEARAETELAFMPTTGETSQPIGHYELCQATPAECSVRTASPVAIGLDERLWAQLVSINATVNAAIAPATDQQLFGREEVWFFPTTQGDCEDYALLKRRLLMEAGWPASALLLTVVRKPNGEGHAVLTVRTDRGDFVLDNLRGDIALWSETPYTFVKRQSETNSGHWVAIGDTVQMVGR